MATKKYKYLFGPVPSRRFNRSLGVDLIPYKTCSLNCVFCDLGRTLHPTINRTEYNPTDNIINELKRWFHSGIKADYITLAGTGEPTLHSKFGRILEFIKMNTDTPSVLLTNGTMFYLEEVRNAAVTADIVKVSLSVWDQSSYSWINRPHPELTYKMLVEGQKAFRKQYKGQLWMEVFFIGGMNTVTSDVKKISSIISSIEPDRIQLNTAVRPAAEEYVTAVSKEQLQKLVHEFHPGAEIIPEFVNRMTDSFYTSQEKIYSLLKRRPCTIEQIMSVYNIHINEATKYLENLIAANKIYSIRMKNNAYYMVIR